MPEDDHPIKVEKVRKVRRFFHEIGHEIDPITHDASRELSALSEQLSTLNLEELPLTLKVKVGEQEYSTVRRLEASQLSTHEIPSENPYHHIIQHGVSSKLIVDGQIGVLVLPSALGVDPVSQEATDFLNRQVDIEEHMGWKTLFPLALSRGFQFNRSDWSFQNSGEMVLVKNIGGRFFTNTGHFLTKEKLVSGKPIEMVVEAKPVKDGTLTLWHQSYMWSGEQISAQKEMNEKLGRMYVLQKGASEKEEKRNPVKARTISFSVE